MSTSSPVIIIGAGLCGLTTAYRLQRAGIPFRIVEARDRMGGRIHTVRNEQGTPIEMGATWLGEKHSAINALLQELGLSIEEQYLGQHAIYEPLSTSPPQLVKLPANDAPSYRITGTSSNLINTIASHLPAAHIHLGEVIEKIAYTNSLFTLQTNNNTYEATTVISTLPPNLLVQTIDCSPAWPAELQQVAQQTHTWMGESIKVGFTYAAPFWRAEKLSGTLFSNVGPVSEMYDHSDDQHGFYALKGFLNAAYHSLSKAERCELVLRQLRKYYGARADQYLSYEEGVWRQETYTFTDYPQAVLPHQNNGHASYQTPLFGGRFFVGGAETASQFPGYMDGAVRSANAIAQHIIALESS